MGHYTVLDYREEREPNTLFIFTPQTFSCYCRPTMRYMALYSSSPKPETPDLLFEERLASQPVARRLGAIPLADDPSASATLPIQPEMVSGPTTDSLPVVGMVSSALCLAGCLVKRFYGQLKARVRRDSFGFLPDSRRPSLTNA